MRPPREVSPNLSAAASARNLKLNGSAASAARLEAVGAGIELARSGAFSVPARPTPPKEDLVGLAPPRLVSSLMWLGLGQNEARMYLGLARTGPASARDAIASSHLDRATGYRVLIRLKERGLVAAEGRWPRRFRTVELRDLWSRIVALVREEADLHQTILENLPGAPAPAASPMEGTVTTPTTRMLTASEQDFESLLETIRGAREEVLVVLPSRPFPTRQRGLLVRELGEAVRRNVRVRLVVDHHAADLRLLRGLPKGAPSTDEVFQTRFFVPAFLHLYVADRRTAVRFLGLSSASYRGPFVGLASDAPDWVRVQEARFQLVWDGAGSIDVPSAPPSPPTPHSERTPRPAVGLRLSWAREADPTGAVRDSVLGLGAAALSPSSPLGHRRLTR